MKINLKNRELKPAIDFLENIDLKANKDSRHRTKLVKQIRMAFEEFVEEEKELMIKFRLLDEENRLKKEEERALQDVLSFSKEQSILLEEEVVIEGGMYAKNFDQIPRILEEYNGMLSGKEADIYDRLMDEFEQEENKHVKD